MRLRFKFNQYANLINTQFRFKFIQNLQLYSIQNAPKLLQAITLFNHLPLVAYLNWVVLDNPWGTFFWLRTKITCPPAPPQPRLIVH